jgi:hypothetical protein
MMAPRAGFNPDQIRDKARKDLLNLLEGVRGSLLPHAATRSHTPLRFAERRISSSTRA